MSQSIASNPPIPFVGRIPGGLNVGASLHIDGIMNHGNRPRFNLNIQDTFSSENFVPLHLSFRSDENCIVRNNRVQSTWGVEERQGGTPVRQGQQFRLSITAEATAFTISVNGVRFTSYQYRLGLDKAQFINIHGDVRILHIIVENNNSGCPPIQICPPVHHNVHHPTVPVMPHINPIQPPYNPIHPVAPVHPHHPHHHHHHGDCHKPTKEDKIRQKCEKKLKKLEKKREKKDKKRRGSSSSSSSSD